MSYASNMETYAVTRRLLLMAAQKLCDDFASQKDTQTLLSHFSTALEPEAIEHGAPHLAPFLGRRFVGLQGIQAYFELLAKLLTYRNMSFSEYMVDVEERKVAVKGMAEFEWIATGNKWDETFVYVLDFDEQDKVKRYQVWADSGAAYLARMGELRSQ
ncbi:hypothetical protein JB92DRAFT_2844474 [Gautieria morchelliformis]|nr:hypothetical protein JB92DRAFT_2844474 [Gautieria morchelliformis]